MESSWLWLPAGLFALHFSVHLWKRARRGQDAAFSEWLLAAGAGYAAWYFGPDLWNQDRLAQAVVIALGWCAATPVLTFIWHGRGGQRRRWLLRACLVLLIFVSVTLISATAFPLRPASALGAAAALLVIIAPRLHRHTRRWWSRHRHWRQQRQIQRREARRLRLEEQTLRRSQQRADRAEQKLEVTERELTKLRKREVAEQDRLERRRAEVRDQLRTARAWEREQSRVQGGMTVHPSPYGFLLLEAARVLRAEIAAGERIPPIESDQFLFEIADRLLAELDFEARYLHGAGEHAALLLHRYLRAELPLREVTATLETLALERRHLAPSPLPSPLVPALLSAWLEPHRRFQEQQRQRYRASQHPHQAVISDFLRPRCSGLPESSTWQTYWDDSPAVFVHGQNTPTTPSRPLSPRKDPSSRSGTSPGPVRRWIAAWSSGKKSTTMPKSSG